jgi:hypothetical protein
MRIQAASLAQVRKGRDGRMIAIEDDVLDVAKQLTAIDKDLRLRWSESGEYFVVYQLVGDREKLVLTSTELNPQIVERVRQIARPGYDFGAELERMDAEAEKDKEHRFHEDVGERSELLAHTLRKDLQAKNKIIVP